MIQSAQITRLDPDGKPPYQSQNGPLYGFRVEFDNGQGGLVNSKSQTPPYGLGQTVYYEVTGQVGKLNKLKISKNSPMGQPQMAPPVTAPSFRPSQVKVMNEFGAATEKDASVESLKPVFGATVGCYEKIAIDLLTQGLTHDEVIERIITPAFWYSVHEVTSDLIRVHQRLEEGHLAKSVTERSKGHQEARNSPPARPAPQSHPDLEPADPPF